MYIMITILSFVLSNDMTTYIEMESPRAFETYLDCKNYVPLEKKRIRYELKAGGIPIPEEAVQAAELGSLCVPRKIAALK